MDGIPKRYDQYTMRPSYESLIIWTNRLWFLFKSNFKVRVNIPVLYCHVTAFYYFTLKLKVFQSCSSSLKLQQSTSISLAEILLIIEERMSQIKNEEMTSFSLTPEIFLASYWWSKHITIWELEKTPLVERFCMTRLCPTFNISIWQ